MVDGKLLNNIINIARGFTCCPICGNENATKHYCKECKQEFNERETAFYFSCFLQKAKKRGDFDCVGEENVSRDN